MNILQKPLNLSDTLVDRIADVSYVEVQWECGIFRGKGVILTRSTNCCFF